MQIFVYPWHASEFRRGMIGNEDDNGVLAVLAPFRDQSTRGGREFLWRVERTVRRIFAQTLQLFEEKLRLHCDQYHGSHTRCGFMRLDGCTPLVFQIESALIEMAISVPDDHTMHIISAHVTACRVWQPEMVAFATLTYRYFMLKNGNSNLTADDSALFLQTDNTPAEYGEEFAALGPHNILPSPPASVEIPG
jgi:hypothetical protein